jgi:hypothetical protein
VNRGCETPELIGIAAVCAGGLAAIDVVHVARRRISPVYLLDAVVELGVLGGLALRRSSTG